MFDIDTLEIEELERLRDAVNRRILSMRRTTGLALPELLRLLEEVKATLADQGKEWFSLERWQYMDGDIRFWLNPKDQELHSTGWFTIDELIAWGRDTGPIMLDAEDDSFEDGTDSEPWGASQHHSTSDETEQHLRLQRFERF